MHICCAPCGIYPINQYRDIGQITGFYFNPNVHPYQEYLNRRLAVSDYSKTIGLDVIFPEYEPNIFFRETAYHQQKPIRCRDCWRIRLERTARLAAENGFEAFSTTLLISPYQDHLVIKTMGEDIAKRFDINFCYRDLRTGFRESRAEARRRSLYMQKYCGCIYSEIERFSKKPALDNVRA
ncbi:MAG: epoxyqueuosine reductase QueH [Candidatus Omnitrophica bacterium]|nr:epoxyqueuosine reductase QueH [Candidatus Omnitrophota bacterium]